MRKLITKGGGGQVYLGDAASERVGVYGKKVIIKFITDKYISLGELQRLAFDQEVATMMTLKDCPNIAKIIGYSDLPCVIVMKYYKDGSLVKWIHQKNLVRNERFYLAFDIAFGIYQLHKRDIAHCDLKPPNVLIETQNGMLRAYLTDFGIAQVVSTRILATNSFRLANLRGLSVRYASPEAFIRFRHRVEDTAEVVKAGDIYSYSMILFELLNKIFPWN
jgi:serine/threonine protein kinase